jgi:hypothetical protein
VGLSSIGVGNIVIDDEGFVAPAALVPAGRLPRDVREIAWSQLACGKLIGKGAMGSVFLGNYLPPVS